MLHRLAVSLVLAVVLGAVLALSNPPRAVTYAAMIAFCGVGGLLVLLPRSGVRWPPRPFPLRDHGERWSQRAATPPR